MNNNNLMKSQANMNNPYAIRHEIQRFESVHPSIYAIYDLIELIPDKQIATQIREHIVVIEDSFVNSQEWTISRAVPDLRLGIVGSFNSGKSALVHRYLTGSYMQEESPEGGRFKKEIQIDNQSYLLLIRDEGEAPEIQFSAWVDAVIFVFSLENEASFNAVHSYYGKMSSYRDIDIPIILVGTQDAISDRCPRVIDDSRARKLANDLKRCSYFETCALYGLNVERVFQEACQKIVMSRILQTPAHGTPSNSRPTTPTTRMGIASYHHTMQHNISSPTNMSAIGSSPCTNSLSPNFFHGYSGNNSTTLPHSRQANIASSHQTNKFNPAELAFLEGSHNASSSKSSIHQSGNLISMLADNNNSPKFIQHERASCVNSNPQLSQTLENLQILGSPNQKDQHHTPISTPTTARKSRRRSNLFIPSSKKDDKFKNNELGSGRSIPLKQGYLYKKSSKTLNKEWKKKYVTLCDDGKLTYHPSLHDYMDDVHGKEIPLQFVTIKVPGQMRPRGSRSIITNSALLSSKPSSARSSINNNNINNNNQTSLMTEGLGMLSLLKDRKTSSEKVLLTAFDSLKESGRAPSSVSGDESGIALSNSNSQSFPLNDANGKNNDSQTPNVTKKRHRRMKSSGQKNDNEDADGYEFIIVSLDNKQWHFEAANSDERDEWVQIIEQEIFKSLQGNESLKPKSQNGDDIAIAIESIRSEMPGNKFCADCDSATPEWASLNLGVLICIECSGVHRNLGSHVSKVRSLTLDEWPPGHLAVMLSVGNNLANSVWESTLKNGGILKPVPTTSGEEKEKFIRKKYETKEFLPPLNSNIPIGQQLIESVVKSDMKMIISLVAHTGSQFVNCTVSPRDLRTPLHFSCAIGNLSITQLLVWYNANLKQTDHEGRTCLTYAKAANELARVKQSNGKPHHVSSETTAALVQLLESLHCVDPSPLCAINFDTTTGGT